MSSFFIKDDQALKQHFTNLNDITRIAIDTEFMRRDTYYAIPALIQLAYKYQDETIVVFCDPVSITNWEPLKELLSFTPECIMHSSSQDFEIFDILFGDWKFNIVDTQIASALLGTQPQLGYAGLIQNELEVTLDKSQSRTNWLQRPLTQAQLKYAEGDVTYLLQAWEKLHIRLIEQDRIDWFNYDCSTLLDTHHAGKNLKSAWKKVKGIRRLESDEFTIAAQLAEWREAKARERNLPRRWLLADDAIHSIAEHTGNLKEAQTQWKVLKEHNDEVQALIDKPDEYYKTLENVRTDALNEKEKAYLQKLKGFCTQQAKALEIESSTLVSRKILEKIVRGNTSFLDSNNWRHKILLSYLDEHVLI